MLYLEGDTSCFGRRSCIDLLRIQWGGGGGVRQSLNIQVLAFFFYASSSHVQTYKVFYLFNKEM